MWDARASLHSLAAGATPALPGLRAPGLHFLNYIAAIKVEASRLARVVIGLYMTSLVLLPWSWFPPFPWLHEHAQWSDAVFALTAFVWVIEKWQARTWIEWRPLHTSIGLYLGAATLSLIFASPNKQLGTMKLIGMVELGVIAIITADLAARPKVGEVMALALALTSLLVAAAVVGGLVLFYSGVHTRLVGTYGDLLPSPWYARMQAATIHPNMLASYCVFAAAVIARHKATLPVWLRRVTPLVLGVTVLTTFSRSLLVFALMAALRRAKTRWQRIALGLAVAACIGIIGSLTIWNLSLDPARPTQVHWELNQNSSRWEALTTSWQTLVAHPLWGSGVETEPGQRFGRPFNAHCSPLNIAATLGLPALLAFAAIFFFLWRDRCRPTDWAIWSGIAGLGLEALAQDVEDFRHLWVLVGWAGVASPPSQFIRA